jgi:antitoxin (DNA-binding transcriptional repressor) of toxin-antitoxin stability system
MKEVTTFELERDCDQLLDEVRSGAEIQITKDGEVIARMVPASPENIRRAEAEWKRRKREKQGESPA